MGYMLSGFPLTWAVVGIGAVICCYLTGVEAFLRVPCHSRSSYVAAMGSVRKSSCKTFSLKCLDLCFYCTHDCRCCLIRCVEGGCETYSRGSSYQVENTLLLHIV